MKNDKIESLEEVLEMKESVKNDFFNSGYDSYAKFIENDVMELKQYLNERFEKKVKQIITT